MGIVLLKTAGAAGEYCRIGYFDIPESEDYWSSPRQIFRKILRDVGAATAEAGCAEAVSNPEYPSEKYVYHSIATAFVIQCVKDAVSP